MKSIRVAILAASVVGASSALAVPVTVIGSQFDISYDSALVGLFGAPVVIGNQVSWFPSGSPGFAASSSAGFNVVNASFSLQLTAHPGFQFTGFGLAEAGSYFHFGAGSLVSVSGQLRVTPLPGVTATAPLAAADPFVANSFLDFSTHDWTASTSVTALPAATSVANVSIQNILAAFVPASTVGFALVDKSGVFLNVGIAAVPEPETYGMMLAGLGLVGLLAFRRRQRD